LSLRLFAATCAVKAGRFLQQLPVFLLRPRQLVRFSQGSYARSSAVDSWSDPELVLGGLFEEERQLLDRLPEKRGDLLLLGIGGGREALVFARAGYRVTGVDFVAPMVARAMENACREGLVLEGRVQDISRMQPDGHRYDVVWFSCSTYSALPGRKLRVRVLKRIREMLAPGGQVICMFYWNPDLQKRRRLWRLGKVFAWIALGNRHCEPGDLLKDYREFLHAFGERRDLEAEFAEAGLEALEFVILPDSHNGGAILRVRSPVDGGG